VETLQIIRPYNGTLEKGVTMLVLTRKIGEEIVIGGCIRIKVADIRGSRVRIAIEAPRELSVQRQEIALELSATAEPEPVSRRLREAVPA
jgi:carbon storage regulator